MQWTDEAVRTLKKLWAQGLPARDIADKLGGISRNSVIGKAHRLGLSGKTKSAETELETPPRVTSLELTERMCRWPIGHPGEQGFHFCGKQRLAGRSYCSQHCGLAYRGRAEQAA